MEPENLRFGGGSSVSIIHPAVLVAMVVVVVLLLILPRKRVLLPYLAIILLTPLGQQFVVAGIHLYVFRVVTLITCLRIASIARSSREPLFAGGFNPVDKVFFLWLIFRVMAFMARNPSSAALINQVGFVWGSVGVYLSLRFLIRDQEDMKKAIKWFAVFAMIMAVCMVNERMTGRNVFGMLGGVPLISEVRDGHIRSQGVFQHALRAGTYGATLLPLLILLWRYWKVRVLALLGMIASVVMVVATASSTPILTLAMGIGAIFAWPFRRNLRLFRWGLSLGLIGLHLVMKAPVWFLIGHMAVLGGSSSDQRAHLVDLFIRHFGEWWLIGTNNNASWGYSMWDTVNGYVEEGILGGFAAFVLFIVVITRCFGRIGTARKLVDGDREQEFFFWLLGAALFTHIVAFFGISYTDNIQFYWLAVLAMISAATAPVLARVAAKKPVEEEIMAVPWGDVSLTVSSPPGGGSWGPNDRGF